MKRLIYIYIVRHSSLDKSCQQLSLKAALLKQNASFCSLTTSSPVTVAVVLLAIFKASLSLPSLNKCFWRKCCIFSYIQTATKPHIWWPKSLIWNMHFFCEELGKLQLVCAVALRCIAIVGYWCWQTIKIEKEKMFYKFQ